MPQRQTILNHLIKYGKINTVQCFKKHNITRLSEYISELRKLGYNIINVDIQRAKSVRGRKPVNYILKKSTADTVKS